jgi:hypothetical protein
MQQRLYEHPRRNVDTASRITLSSSRNSISSVRTRHIALLKMSPGNILYSYWRWLFLKVFWLPPPESRPLAFRDGSLPHTAPIVLLRSARDNSGGSFCYGRAAHPVRSPKMSPRHTLYLRPGVVVLHLRLHAARAAPSPTAANQGAAPLPFHHMLRAEQLQRCFTCAT